MIETVVDLRFIVIQLSLRNALAGVAFVLAVDFTQQSSDPLLLGALGGILREVWVYEVIETRQLLETVLAAKFVVARHAALAVADNVQRQDIDLPSGALQPRQTQILKKKWMI